MSLGTFYSGKRRELSGGLSLRPRPGVLVTLDASFNRFELPEGDFSTKVLRTVVNFQLSPFVSLSNNVQFDSVSRRLGWQSGFPWMVSPGNDVYLVWTSQWLDEGERLASAGKRSAAKVVCTTASDG